MQEPRFRLLLAGGDPVYAEWSKGLERKGYQVARVASGWDALSRLDQDEFDLILMDAEPSGDALAAFRALRRRHSSSELPVILSTRLAESDRVVEAFDLGADDHVHRSIELPVLVARIEAQLRRRLPTAPAVASPPPELAPGTVLDGKYEIGPLIGRGRFGMVYRAEHLKLRRRVAVKVLLPSPLHTRESLERFRREGVSACQIDHPNAVAVLDLSTTVDGLPFLVMELLEGHSLDVEIRRAGNLSPLHAAVILLPVCEVLAEAHALGIVHRDVKPHNIFLHRTRRGEVVKLIDFGISKLVDDEILGQELTLDGVGPGTPTYMAPERFSGKPYDDRADVYALGVTLYEMLAGHPPFHASSGNPIKVALMHMNLPPPSLVDELPELPRAVEKVVLRALAKDPEERPTATGLALDLVRALGLELPAPLARAFGISDP